MFVDTGPFAVTQPNSFRIGSAMSQTIDEIYEFARRQALKIEQKLVQASTLLDRV
jgi:hypothetical protein